jgi:putative ABC transport system permease protein
MDTLWLDLRYGMRTISRNPGFAALAVLVLALGIGVNTAIFSLVNATLLKPLKIENPDEIVGLYSRSTEKPDTYRGFSYPNYVEIRDRNIIFSSLAAHDLAIVGINEGETTRRTFAELVTGNYFSTFGVHLFQGREFTPDEETPGSEIPVAIVSYGYWNKRAKDPDLIGKVIRVNSRSYTIIGIAPEGFTGTMALLSPEVWLPLGMHAASGFDLDGDKRSLADPGYHQLFVVGRLRSGLSQEQADSQLGVLASQLEKEYPELTDHQTLIVHSRSRIGLNTRPDELSGVTAASTLVSAMAGVVLLIACLNLANMMLARGTSRRKEIAIRLALGGSRRRLIRQLLTEGLLLSLAGGATGLLLSYWGMQLLTNSLEAVIPFGIVPIAGLDVRVLIATLGFCLLSTLVFGFGPAWKCSRPNVVPDLKESVGGEVFYAGKRRWLAARNLLVVGQLALSLVLLAAGGLFLRGALEAAGVDPGFRMDRSVLIELDAGLIGYDDTRGLRVYSDLVERLRALPGVEQVSLAATVPFGNVRLGERVRPAGGAPVIESDPNDRSVSAGFNAIGADYFRALDVQLLRGRFFNRSETENDSAAPVAIINDELARRLFPGKDALGQNIQYGDADTEEGRRIFEIVGIVPTLQHSLIPARAEPYVYVPFGQGYRSNVHLHIAVSPRGKGAEDDLLQAVRREIRSADANMPVLNARSFHDHFDTSAELWLVRTGARLFSVFGALALFLAAAGVYGVRAYMVAQRTREIGIRMALGATRRDAVRLVLREGFSLTLSGLGIGLVLALMTGQLLSSMLYRVSATDPAVFVVTPLVLMVVSLLACYVPARRAATVNTMVALRHE